MSLVSALACCGGAPPAPRAPAERARGPAKAEAEVELAFSIEEGRIQNRFLRAGKVAAHVLATSGDAPRLVFAFPAGNMGAGAWFEGAAELAFEGDLAAVERPDGMRGARASLRARAPRLTLRRAILGSVRVLRNAGHGEPLPKGYENAVEAGPPIVLRRTTLDGKHRMELRLEPKAGTAASVSADGAVTLTGASGGDVAFDATALSDEAPLTPIPKAAILDGAASDPRALEVLSFLSYDEKLLAGSWQYLTYFGRDTLLSTRLLMPALTPRMIEAALGAVIERLREDGDVAHEEDVGEWAAMENLHATPPPADVRAPRYDYKMVDDDFLLAPVLAAYVLDREAGRARAGAFFARKTTGGRTFAAAVRANLERVLAKAKPFADRPSVESLVHIEPDLSVGNWRDSLEGLGNGKIPYDVNAALVPAALRAAERLFALDALGKDRALAARAGELAGAWSKAEPMFRVQIPADEAKRRVTAYAKEQGLDARDALAAVDGPVAFDAVSLDAKGKPVPIQNTDDGFVMLFGDPSPEWLAIAAKHVTAPFPAGLRTPVGVVVANPAYATDEKLRAIFTRDHYHGTVVWSWQQALLLSGLRRQLARADLPPASKRALAEAEDALAKVIAATSSMRTSELWSFAADEKGYRVAPFGQSKGHHTEANAAQLWSTVFLALDRR